MLSVKVDKTDVGIIIGRFQIHDLHAGHKELIDSVVASHDKVIIFLGLSPLRNTLEDPLDYRCRRAMINESYPEIEVHYIDDIPDDDVLWSKNLDALILKWTNPDQSILLYGGRDSFIKHYFGKYKTRELEAKTIVSATEIRRRVCNNYPPTRDYRAGLMASTTMRFPAVNPTVDIAILNSKEEKVLLIKKLEEEHLRFPGGFAIKSPSFEHDAKREKTEETKTETSEPKYIGSALIDDPRYRGKRDCIKTLFFVVEYIFGKPDVNNEADLTEKIESYHWVSYKDLKSAIVQSEHHPLMEMLIDYLIKKKFENAEAKSKFDAAVDEAVKIALTKKT